MFNHDQPTNFDIDEQNEMDALRTFEGFLFCFPDNQYVLIINRLMKSN